MPFQALGVQKTGGIPDNQEPVRIRSGHRVIASLRYCLGPVREHLPAFEHLRHEGVSLELLEQGMRIGLGVLIVETNHEPDMDHVVPKAVDEASAEFARSERIAEGVEDGPGRDVPVRLPGLLDAHRIDLRMPAVVETQPSLCLQRQRSAGPLAEHGDFCPNVDSRFKIGLWAPLACRGPCHRCGHRRRGCHRKGAPRRGTQGKPGSRSTRRALPSI